MSDDSGQPSRACPWCGSADTARIGDAGSLLMTEQWFCDGCSSAFEVIRKRGRDVGGRVGPRGPIVSTGSSATATGPADPGEAG